MSDKQLPTYAVFDDYRYSQRIAVAVRWFLLAAWLTLINYRAGLTEELITLNFMGLALALLNGHVHLRIMRGRPIAGGYVVALSVMDLSLITFGIAVTSAFGNTFFVLYYPALLGVSLVFSSPRMAFAAVTVVAIVYALVSILLEPGLSSEVAEEKVLAIRIAAMFAVVAAGSLMTRIERERRREAVEAERARAAENLELQRKAQEAELAAQKEKDRIAREIHDGIAQSIYALSLNLETCADLAERVEGPLRDQLKKLVPLAKKTLLESRHYIFDLKPLLSGERDISAIAENQVREFRTVAGVPIQLTVECQPIEVSVAVASGFYRILQEALANVLKHAHASKVDVGLAFEPDRVRLLVQDDGVGIEVDGAPPGYGLQNMRQRAEELAGCFGITGSRGHGTRINVELPANGGAA